MEREIMYQRIMKILENVVKIEKILKNSVKIKGKSGPIIMNFVGNFAKIVEIDMKISKIIVDVTKKSQKPMKIS